MMTASLEQRVETLENQNDYLGNVLGQFISSVNGVMLRMEALVAGFREEISAFKEEVRADTKAFKEEVRADTKALKKEMAEFKDEVRADTKAFREEVRADTKAFKEGVRADTKALKEEMAEFKEEVRADTKALKKEMAEFKDEVRADTKSLKNEMKGLRKETGMLTRKMGTLVEDMVAPNMRLIAKEYFGDDDFTFFGVRFSKKNAARKEKEFDVVAVSDKNFIINETKSKPRPEDIGDFIEVIADIGSYFPEYQGRRIIPVFSSLYLPENIQTYLTRNGIYAMGLKEGTMDLLNFEQISN